MSNARVEGDLAGKTALVTGATGGIGKEIARGLARLGANVVIGARNAERGAAVRAELAAGAKGTISVLTLDVSDIASIRAAVAGFDKTHERLDLLVNNAGAWFTERRTSKDGHELTLATNVIGPYLLTKLLEPRLRASAAARVVNIASGLASNYDAEDLQFQRRKYDGFKAYGQSKLALRMLTWGQAKHFAGSSVTVNVAVPGFVKTDFNQNASGFTAAMINFFAKLFAVTPEKGADTALWCCVAPELAGQTAKYFEARKEKDGKFRDAAAVSDLERRLEQLVPAA